MESNEVSRRGVLASAGAVAAGAVLASGGTAAAAPETAASGAVVIRPGDRRYDGLLRGDNFRFTGRPDEIRVVSSTGEVVAAVSEAVRSGRRVAVRSGGHCFEGFTAEPGVRMLLDLSPMNEVGFDARRGAFAVQPGATIGQVCTTLFKRWGVTIPAGGCPEVGAGGHFAGGGYGPLSRRYGSVVDHLYAVEVVVAGADGRVRTVVATREPGDPNRELWWAHTGGGGGNFGVVTRYWLRAPDATGDDPAGLLPPSPSNMLGWLVLWRWDERMTERAFTALLRNFGTWHERNSAPGSPAAGLYAVLMALHRKAGSVQVVVQMDADLPNAKGLLAEFVAEVGAGTGLEPTVNDGVTLPWLHMTTWPGNGEGGDKTTRRSKLKAGYLRRSLTDAQLATIYAKLDDEEGTDKDGMLLIGYGGQIGAVPPGATAVAQRDAIMKAVYQTTWQSETEDNVRLKWIREFYRAVYHETGGVPVPNEVSDGSYINYPDVDLADPEWNTSGVPWSTLYYKDDYPRLQRVKARWDPKNVFHHALGIELPS
ncbi:FAD-binding oxidoreductase [Amycolatopsis sp. CA-230715]|uniref:FAD-binding oxidoreductase n=1 Tax=Amycolatopsis sp. CA-230715 TaxID=2745196 RepID=UPI001C03983A|nr:FAD-binding protein [Amycolatopsis sp. CA-230715]QWF80964.1 Aclacinomycin-N/aclacinomycin-A oxidase [Amycolatopsis sp. CA-230715]